MSDSRQFIEKLTGIYRGKVVKHLENGLVKVYIPDIYPFEWASQPDKLPDAEIVVPMFGGNNNGNGVFSYPNIGAIVVCQFLNGDQNLPIVIGATQGGALAAMKYHEVANELDPSTGKEPSCIHMFAVGRSKIKVYEGGQIELRVDGADKNASSITIDKKGNIVVNCDGNFQINAKNIRMAAKEYMYTVSGKTTGLTSREDMFLQGKNITASCDKGVLNIETKHRVTQF